MEKTNQAKIDSHYSDGRPLQSSLKAGIRLNLNDLLKKRQEERKVDKKTNLIILSGATAVAAVVFVILSL